MKFSVGQTAPATAREVSTPTTGMSVAEQIFSQIFKKISVPPFAATAVVTLPPIAYSVHIIGNIAFTNINKVRGKNSSEKGYYQLANDVLAL